MDSQLPLNGPIVVKRVSTKGLLEGKTNISMQNICGSHHHRRWNDGGENETEIKDLRKKERTE